MIRTATKPMLSRAGVPTLSLPSPWFPVALLTMQMQIASNWYSTWYINNSHPVRMEDSHEMENGHDLFKSVIDDSNEQLFFRLKQYSKQHSHYRRVLHTAFGHFATHLAGSYYSLFAFIHFEHYPISICPVWKCTIANDMFVDSNDRGQWRMPMSAFRDHVYAAATRYIEIIQ